MFPTYRKQFHVFFTSTIRLKFEKKKKKKKKKRKKQKAKATQNPDAELLLLENYLLFSCTFSFKNITYSKERVIKQVCINC